MAKKTGSYLVMLETADKEPPTLITKVKPTDKKNRFLISILHPNTQEVLYEKVHQVADFNEAFKLANEIKKRPDIKSTKTWYEEKRFIPAPKKGKMKLFTKEEAEAEEAAKAEKDSGSGSGGKKGAKSLKKDTKTPKKEPKDLKKGLKSPKKEEKVEKKAVAPKKAGSKVKIGKKSKK